MMNVLLLPPSNTQNMNNALDGGNGPHFVTTPSSDIIHEPPMHTLCVKLCANRCCIGEFNLSIVATRNQATSEVRGLGQLLYDANFLDSKGCCTTLYMAIPGRAFDHHFEH